MKRKEEEGELSCKGTKEGEREEVTRGDEPWTSTPAESPGSLSSRIWSRVGRYRHALGESLKPREVREATRTTRGKARGRKRSARAQPTLQRCPSTGFEAALKPCVQYAAIARSYLRKRRRPSEVVVGEEERRRRRTEEEKVPTVPRRRFSS